jgi:nitroreductase
LSIRELIQKRRTIRRFRQEKIESEILSEIIDSARLAPSASNLQPLEFVLVDDPPVVEQIFPFTKWAGYLPNDSGRPPKGSEPVTYVVVLINRDIAFNGGEHDVGAAVENMILTALYHNIGSCWIASVNRKNVRALLKIPSIYEIDCILALGYPDENPVIEPISNSVKYYKDDEGVLHVPKRKLDDIMHRNQF